MAPRILNLDALKYQKRSHGENYAADVAWIAAAMETDKLGFSVGVIPPGKRAFPYHAHHGNDELFFIMEGEGSLRLNGETRPIRQGDFISLPAGPDSAHQIINDSAAPLRYLAISTMETPEVVSYPDSGKVGVITGKMAGQPPAAGDLRHWLRLRDSIGYWDDED